jgi:MinD-like ATPase involved in chromosome partitioning or flagellar assembly
VTLVAFCSGKGSPGVSTLASVVGAVWPQERQIVVAECDPSGNDLAARFRLSPRLGMTSLVLAHRRSSAAESKTMLDGHLQTLPGGLEVLVGPVNPDASSSLDRELGGVVPTIFPSGVDILVDCGRIVSGAGGQLEILKVADHVVVTTRSDAAAFAHTLWTLDRIRDMTTKLTCSIAVVGPGPFRVGEIEHVLQARVLGVIPFDPRSAEVACGLPGKLSRFARSTLVSAARRLVEQLLSQPGSTVEGRASIDLVNDEVREGDADRQSPGIFQSEFATSKKRGAEPG